MVLNWISNKIELYKLIKGKRKPKNEEERAYFIGVHTEWLAEEGTNRMEQLQFFMNFTKQFNLSNDAAWDNAIDCISIAIKDKKYPLGIYLLDRIEQLIIYPDSPTPEELSAIKKGKQSLIELRLKWGNLDTDKQYSEMNSINAIKVNQSSEQEHANSSTNGSEEYKIGQQILSRDESPQTLVEAAPHFFKAANLGNPDAQAILGQMYLDGRGVVEDIDKAMYYFELAAEQGDLGSINILASIYWGGIPGRRNEEKAIKWTVMANKRRDENDWLTTTTRESPEFQFVYGKGLETGKLFAQDLPAALKAYLKAAQQGHIEAQVSLAHMYCDGRGTRQDYKEAASWFLLAAERGHPGAQSNLGIMYASGLGVDQDFNKAARWSMAAVKQGQPQAQADVGRLYLKGMGLNQDLTEAARWLLLAAQAGEPSAQVDVGMMYLNGVGLDRDFALAARWLLSAAELGEPPAQWIVGMWYYEGMVLDRDLEKGMHWLNKAASQGEENAIAYLRELGPRK